MIGRGCTYDGSIPYMLKFSQGYFTIALNKLATQIDHSLDFAT